MICKICLRELKVNFVEGFAVLAIATPNPFEL